MLSCQRRALTYDYDPTVEIVINADWSDMEGTPTGMSVYCYPEDGGKPTVAIANINSKESSIRVQLGAGIYNILVFNQIPSDYGTVGFSGMESYETASINAVSTTSKWAVSKGEDDLVRDPEEVAAATYLDLEVTEEAIREIIEMRSKGETKAEDMIYITIDVAPKVVVKTSRVKIKLDGIHNYRSARATLYGMATGYNFAEQKSYSDKVTHILESWTSTVYEGDFRYGEITAFHTSFGLPGQTTETRGDDFSQWEGELDIDYLLVDNKTIFSESYDLAGHVTLAEELITASGEGDNQGDVNDPADIYIDLENAPLTTLPDVKPEGGAEGGFDATIDDWGDEEIHDIPI